MEKIRYVPGKDCIEHPLDEQADMLMKKLTGHQIFARMRGKVKGHALWTLLDGVSGVSPSSSLREYDAFVSDLRVMRNLVVWLRWHGYRKAAGELAHALSDGEKRIWCEDVPFDARTPCTILMFKPTETLRLCEWWSHGGRDQLYNLYFERIDKTLYPDFDCSNIKHHDTAALLELYPELKDVKRYSDSSKKVFHSIMMGRINLPLMSGIPTHAKVEFGRDKMSFVGKNYPLYSGETVDVGDRAEAYKQGAFAYFFPRKEQAEVLSWFPRNIQDGLATWYMRIPDQNLHGLVKLNLGLHPESEHALWSKLYPSMVSSGLSQGRGVLLSPDREYEENKDHLVLRSW